MLCCLTNIGRSATLRVSKVFYIMPFYRLAVEQPTMAFGGQMRWERLETQSSTFTVRGAVPQ